ncbi:F-box domain, cyclin-like protein [Artemisia annua]|uniref:F-box domain, cyclin-like protein n=1 Tax=Artemisia annua TaxID=35608 RepID=A0A2U1NHQ3_ARTAN|nr:F-box domain, cyclin-like protein [Artemisia annua]
MGNKSSISHRPRVEEFKEAAASISVLPKGCISDILSLTLPRDASRAAAISKTFNTAADSDAVWEQFLPPDYRQVIARAVSPVNIFETKKELYMYLSDSHVLIDRGTLEISKPLKTINQLENVAEQYYIVEQNDTRITMNEFYNSLMIRDSFGLAVGAKTTVSFGGIRNETSNVYLKQPRAYARDEPLTHAVPTTRKDEHTWLHWALILKLSINSTNVYKVDSVGLAVPAKTTVIFGGIRNEASNVYLKQPRAYAHDEPLTNAAPTTRKDGKNLKICIQSTHGSTDISKIANVCTKMEYIIEWPPSSMCRLIVQMYVGTEEVSLLQAHLLFEWISIQSEFLATNP